MLPRSSTHGEIESRGVRYTPELRFRIEHLCVKEQHKFIKLLAVTNPDLAGKIRYEFDPPIWQQSWKMTRWQRLQAEMKRILFPKK